MIYFSQEDLSSEASTTYEYTIEELLTCYGCPQCFAKLTIEEIDRKDERSEKDRGVYLACQSILQIEHRCRG